MMITKKIFYISFAILCFPFNWVSAILNKTNIDPNWKTILERDATAEQTITKYLEFVKNLLFGLLWIMVVAAFIYVGFLFVTARGKPDEFKKAWMHTIYIIIGIAIVSSAWWIVTLVAGLDF